MKICQGSVLLPFLFIVATYVVTDLTWVCQGSLCMMILYLLGKQFSTLEEMKKDFCEQCLAISTQYGVKM